MRLNFALLVVLLMVATSCNHKTKKTILKEIEQDNVVNSDDCFPERKIVKTIKNQSANVMYFGEIVLLDCPEVGERYQACNVPDWIKKDMKVTISGSVKAIKSNERRAGSPLVLTNIRKKN